MKNKEVNRFIKHLWTIWLSSIIFVMVMLSTVLVALAATNLDSSPNATVEYGYTTSTPVGTIRYMSQITGSGYFNWNYWPGSSFGGYASPGTECGTASISMALSYVGINKTPKDILNAHNGYTYFGDGWGGTTHQSPSLSTAISNYVSGNGKYSPPIIHLPTYTSQGHYVIIAGKVSDTKYAILDPANDSVGTMTINGTSWSYGGKSGSIDEVHQYYNKDAAVPIPTNPKVTTNLTTYAPGQTVVITPSSNGATYYAISIWIGEYGRGKKVSSVGSFTGSTTFIPTEIGEYTIRMDAINSSGYSYTETTFTVRNVSYSVEGITFPKEILQGTSSYTRGTVSISHAISWAWVGVVDTNNKIVLESESIRPNSSTWNAGDDLNGLDIASLPVGDYVLCMDCRAGGEYLCPGRYEFSVISKAGTTASPVASTTYGAHRYELFDYHMSWTEAQAFCKARGGTLAVITDQSENAAVLSLAEKGAVGIYYIGCSDAANEGSWKWVTGESFAYQNWDTRAPEPTNGTGENYGAIMSRTYPPNKDPGEWIDTSDKVTSGYYAYTNCGFICEYPVNTPTITAQPKSVTVSDGEKATFTVKASNAKTYKWYYRTSSTGSWKAVTDASGTKAAFTKTVSTKMNGYQYFCKVTNAGGSVNSSVATLKVKAAQNPLPFTDVTKSKTYYDAVYWAYFAGIVKGKSETIFAPGANLTRGEFCTMLWRMFGKPAVSDKDVSSMPFADAKKSNHKKAIAWCYKNGVINGYKVNGKQVFKPSNTITRGNIIVMLFKLAKQEKSYKPATIKNPFTDVKSTNKNISAYKWAYQNGVVTTKKFGPGTACKRWEMVSYLYGYNNTYHVVK